MLGIFKKSGIFFDDKPTAGSDNAVTSGGVYDAMTAKQDKMTYTTGEWTLNTDYVTNGTCLWRKFGQLVIVILNDVRLASWTDGDKVLSTNTGPKPIAYSYGSIPPLNATTSSQLFSVTMSGQIVANGGISNSGRFFGSFSYIAQE